ncbi:zinc ABC transporter substrate-binding protein [Oscillatoria amoena NRMC-F 0135]|nr:zinc ABC transporter substrate-binding protein [Oscillatoria laete-virens]MDL5046574.1 zinc ABC transporter substrate-binding protein [Oscillatoria amoena NRMC-F 0135]MDL5053564.1 zinc ABC transporter substrate-binding protein [Oscillatoria laete-virens NRMC-F 0139]
MKHILPLALVWSLTFFSLHAQAKKDKPLEIVTTTAMVADTVRQVAGPHARVTHLMGEGVDPHLYTPTRDDVRKLQRADMIFYNGLYLEGKMEATLKKMAKPGKPVIAVGETLPKAKLLADGENPDHPDPHVWMDAALWAQTIDPVVGALSAQAPAHASTFQANGKKYREQLAALDEKIRAMTASIPEAQRVLITAHDAFQYFSRGYAIEVRGVQGLSTESEAGIKDINDLVDFVVQRKIGAVFVESSVADKNLKALIEGAAARGQKVVIGGELYSDAMGRAGTPEGTYPGMMEHNARTITRALGGKP